MTQEWSNITMAETVNENPAPISNETTLNYEYSTKSGMIIKGFIILILLTLI